MKRSNLEIQSHNIEKPDEKQKKIKPNESSSTSSLYDISSDIWSEIIKYLPIGSVLMFAMTCKNCYEWTNDHIKNVICRYFVKEEPNSHFKLAPSLDYSIIGGLR